MPAVVKILSKGYSNADSVTETGEERTSPTITLVRDGDLIMVVDPGTLKSQQILIDALKEEGLTVNDVNVVCVTHSHIDHYRNIGMFSEAKTLEFFGLWDKDTVVDWQRQFTKNIQIARTPGHDYTGITLFVSTAEGVVAICGDNFWEENYPENPHDDPFASDPEKLKETRVLIAKMSDWIIPGHGGIFKTQKNESNEAAMAVPTKKIKDRALVVCRKCHRPIRRQQDRCLCQPSICYHCCECDLDCDLCTCKHKL